MLKSRRVVFNIKGNDYRLVTAVAYRFGAVCAKFIGTYAEYDRIDANTVDHAHLVKMLVPGVAAVSAHAHDGIERIGLARLGVDEAALAPGVEGQSFDHGAGFVGDRRNAAQVVVVEVAGA